MAILIQSDLLPDRNKPSVAIEEVFSNKTLPDFQD